MSKTLGNHKVMFGLAAIAAAAFLTLPASNADACGPFDVTDEMRVGWAISSHMNAVKSADSKAFARIWNTRIGQSTAVDGTRVRTEPIMVAFRRWSANPDKAMTWKVDRIDVIGGLLATVKLQMTWHGQKRIEYITLAKAKGQWKLVGKVHIGEKPVVAKKAVASPY